MNTFQNIFIIGTSHIAKDSVAYVKEQIEKIQPDIVALELDHGRAYALKHKIRRPKNLTILQSLGVMGFLFYIVGETIQKKLGKIVNIDPGSEMIVALETAEKETALIVLIDRNINITLKRLSKYFKKREIFKLIVDIIKGVFKKGPIEKMDFSKLPPEDIINEVLEQTRKRYPSLYKVLIDERDKYMAKRLYEISSLYPDKKIIAVTGAGHVKGILHYLNKFTEKA
jgi:pheromone shutdown-related protein TraB